MATTAMQDFEGQIPAIFALSSFIWLIFVIYTFWKIQKRYQKDIEKGTYYTIEGKVSALYFNILTLDGKKIRISYNLRRGISVGDRVRLYLTTASKTIFKIEKIFQTPPDVL